MRKGRHASRCAFRNMRKSSSSLDPFVDEQEHCGAPPLASAPFEGGSLVLARIREPDKSTFCNLRRDGFMGSVTPKNKMWGLHWNKTREEHAHHGDYQIVSADD